MAESDEVGIIDSGGNYKNKIVKRLFFKNFDKIVRYLTPKVKLIFTTLKKAFTKAPIFRHFDPEYHILIEINTSSYSIDKVLSQLTSNKLS